MRAKFRLSVMAFLLVISMLLVPVNAMAADVDTASAADSDFILGDADNDGRVTIFDATAIQRFLAELSVLSFNEAAADTDSSGDIEIADATRIQRFLAEMCNVDGSPLDTHTHTLTYVAEVPATATKEGTKAHYKCSVCNKLFSAENQTQEVTAASLVIPKLTQNDPTTCSHHWVRYVIPYDYRDLYLNNRSEIPFTKDGTKNTLKQTNMEALSNHTGWAIYYCDKCHIADYDRFYTNQEFGYTQEEEEQLCLNLVNELRTSLGLKKMRLNSYTTAVARERAKELITDFSHDKARIDTNENIATCSGGAKQAFDLWKESSGHYYNMTKNGYWYFGYAYAVVPPAENGNAHWRLVMIQTFQMMDF